MYSICYTQPKVKFSSLNKKLITKGRWQYVGLLDMYFFHLSTNLQKKNFTQMYQYKILLYASLQNIFGVYKYLRINYFCFQLDTHLVTLLQSEPTNVSYLMHIKHSKGTKYDTFGDKGCMLVFDNEGKSTLHIYNPNFGIQLSSYRAGIASHYIYQDSKLLTSLMYWYICFLPGWSGAEIKCSSMLYPNQFKLDQKR